ncbi:MAG: DUF5996 family protein [Bacteroidota bacterium]|nr:DUF5996 family protein [Bacteroidota bacterium]
MEAITWPEIDFNNWKDTLSTVQLWTQMVGKIRLKAMPWLNHSWHVTLYITPQGLSTGSMPYEAGIFEINFNFQQHLLLITTSNGKEEEIKLYPRSVADFYKELFNKLRKAGIEIAIYAVPNEMENAIPFEQDEQHKTYDKDQMKNYWKALVLVHNVFTRFRAGFCGKCSPVHFFWGAFDLAVTRFSGRRAPNYSGAVLNVPIRVMQEAYSHEVSSCGFWPGSEAFPKAAFYAYCYPTPEAFSTQPVEPTKAFYSKEMGEFFLLYDDVRQATNPEETLLRFLTTTYEAAANTGNWERAALEYDLSSFEQ